MLKGLGEIFGNGMIFQAKKPIRVFGSAVGSVSVTFDGETKSTAAMGNWLIEFAAKDYSDNHILTVKINGEAETYTDIAVGEVILFSGQSNIQFRMREEATPPSEYVSDDFLRIYVSTRPEPHEPLAGHGWVKASPDNIDDWSAVGYLTGRTLRRENIPVGVVACSQGASMIRSWIDRNIFVGSGLDLPNNLCHPDSWYKMYEKWNPAGYLYNTMLSPLFPFSFGNVVWYQGESDSSVAEGKIYLSMLDMMIRNWRDKFMNDTLPFTVVQIADYLHPYQEEGWKLVQAAQAEAADKIPYVKSVICADVCENNMIHPIHKGVLAERICAALVR